MARTVAIIGYGHVGRSLNQIFPDALLYDNQNQAKPPTIATVNQCGLGIICVPTPELEGGACDISIVEEVVEWLDTPLILIKSTVPPGTTDRLKETYGKRIVVSPEYIGESPYWLPESFTPMGWPFLIVGGEPADTGEVVDYFVSRLGPNKTYRQTTARTAELVKYMENAWLSAQVTFANEFYNIAAACEVDYFELRELWALDPRVSKSHTAVFRDQRGFGGKCLPKDLKAIIASSRAAGYDAAFLSALWDANVKFRKAPGGHQ